jgi:hypothetical protein
VGTDASLPVEREEETQGDDDDARFGSIEFACRSESVAIAWADREARAQHVQYFTDSWKSPILEYVPVKRFGYRIVCLPLRETVET